MQTLEAESAVALSRLRRCPPLQRIRPTRIRSRVLPFVNLSDDKGGEYFSDGVSEELLTVLQKIPGLHVAARTSAFSFKGKNATAQEIGQKLGVAHLVEGSVRRSGDSVRIAARLSRVDTGEELWSENYTRDLKDVFAVQAELAQTIVAQLRGRLTVARRILLPKRKSRRKCRRRQKAGRKTSKRIEAYLQGRFYQQSPLRKRQRTKPWPLFNARWSWIPISRWHGRAWPRLTSGIAIMRPRAARRASTLI